MAQCDQLVGPLEPAVERRRAFDRRPVRLQRVGDRLRVADPPGHRERLLGEADPRLAERPPPPRRPQPAAGPPPRPAGLPPPPRPRPRPRAGWPCAPPAPSARRRSAAPPGSPLAPPQAKRRP